MAEKIIIELRDKDFGISLNNVETVKKANTISGDLHISIKSTLTNMGYNPREIDKALSELPE
jgi:Holliday junction resolvasome RuvABC DNA-binding subunit